MASVDNNKLASDHEHQQHDQQIEKVIKEDQESKETEKDQQIPAPSTDLVEEIAKQNPEAEKSVEVDISGSKEEAAEAKQDQPPEAAEVEKVELASVATNVPVESTKKEVETPALVAPDLSGEAAKQPEEKPEPEAVKVVPEEKAKQEPKEEAEPRVSEKESEAKTVLEVAKSDLDGKPAIERVVEAETKDNSASEVIVSETHKPSSTQASTEKPDVKKVVDEGVTPVAPSIKEAAPETAKRETHIQKEEIIDDKPVAAAIEHEKKEDKPLAAAIEPEKEEKPVTVAIEHEKKEISKLEVPESELTKQKELESVQEAEANLEKRQELGTIESDIPKETITEKPEDSKPEEPKSENMESQDIKGALREIEAKALEAVKDPLKEPEERKETTTVPPRDVEAQTTPTEPASDTSTIHMKDSISGKTEEVIKEKDTKIKEEKPEELKPEERSETVTVPPGNVEAQTAPKEPASNTTAMDIENPVSGKLEEVSKEKDTKTEEEKQVDSKPEEPKLESLTEEKPKVVPEVESQDVKEAITGTEAKAIKAEKPDESSNIASEANPSEPATDPIALNTEKPASTKLEELIKESDANNAKHEEAIETKEGNVATEQESSEPGKETSKLEEKETVKEAVEDKKTEPEETTRDLPVKEVITKTTQKSSGNILSKVKHSIVKVKKAITKKSPSSKPATNEVKADEKADEKPK